MMGKFCQCEGGGPLAAEGEGIAVGAVQSAALKQTNSLFGYKTGIKMKINDIFESLRDNFYHICAIIFRIKSNLKDLMSKIRLFLAFYAEKLKNGIGSDAAIFHRTLSKQIIV